MKFPYIVNHNGTYYPAGADVPAEEAIPEVAEETEEAIPEVAEETEEAIPEVAEEARRGRPAKSR